MCSKSLRAVLRRVLVRDEGRRLSARLALTLSDSTGLVPFGDWIVGYAGGILRGEGDFYDVVEAVRFRPSSHPFAR
jgi:hypothetical protein